MRNSLKVKVNNVVYTGFGVVFCLKIALEAEKYVKIIIALEKEDEMLPLNGK